MRRLTEHHDDQGVVTIVLVGFMVILLAGVALSLDVGRFVVEHRSAQNSADARALAIGTDCARTGAPLAVSKYATYLRSTQTANAPSCGGGTVTVTVTKNVNYTFGGVLGLLNQNVARTARVKWGQLTSATGTFPIVIPQCGLSGLTLGTLVTLFSDDVTGCYAGGGMFGFIQNGCSSSLTVVAGNTLPGATGNSFQTKTGCSTAQFNTKFLDKDVYVPIWGTPVVGRNYPIVKYAVFHLTAWSANGNASSDPAQFAFDGVHALPTPAAQNPKKCPTQSGHDDASGACIQGFLKGYVTQAGGTNGVPCAATDACFIYLDS
jgi:Flp pilus assembly protein TadG